MGFIPTLQVIKKRPKLQAASIPDHNIYIIDSVTGSSLKIQNVPKDIVYEPDSRFPGVYTVARNNPIYHYVGSEDSITLELDWYSVQEDRNDVINKCRLLECYTKNNGYDEEIHPVILSMGDLFTSTAGLWLVTAAPYTMTMFDKNQKMLCVQAYQKVTLKRVTDKNRTWDDIISG